MLNISLTIIGYIMSFIITFALLIEFKQSPVGKINNLDVCARE